MMGPLFGIYGASGCGRGILPLAREMLAIEGIPPDRLVFIDDRLASSVVNGHRVVSYAEFLQAEASDRVAAIAIADSRVRQRLAETGRQDGVRDWTIKAGNVVIMDDVVIGEGALLSPFVTITSNIRIGRYFHANIGSIVEHDCVLGDFVTFAPGVKCNGNVHIGDHAYIGAGAMLRQGRPGAPLRIGRGATIGMGAVVLQDVPDGVTVVGNPARILEKKA